MLQTHGRAADRAAVVDDDRFETGVELCSDTIGAGDGAAVDQRTGEPGSFAVELALDHHAAEIARDRPGVFDCAAARQNDAEPVTGNRAVASVRHGRGIIFRRLPIGTEHRYAIGAQRAAARNRAAVADAAAADQPDAVVAFTRDRAAVGDRGAIGEEDELVRRIVEQIDRRNPRTRAADRAAVGDARIGGPNRDARVWYRVKAVIGALTADRPGIVDDQSAARRTIDA